MCQPMHWLESGDLSGSLPNAARPKSRVMLFKHVLNTSTEQNILADMDLHLSAICRVSQGNELYWGSVQTNQVVQKINI